MTVAELIVKLSAQGGDEVKRKLNETEKDLKKTAKAAEETKKPFQDLEIAGVNVSNAIANIGKAYASMSPAMATFIGAAAAGTAITVAFTAAMVGLSAASYKMLFDSRAAGEEFEAMKARLEGLTGSAQRANELMALAAKEAGPSEFTTQQLEQSTVSLAAFGQNVERVLPMITKLGQAMGADQERLMMYTRAMNMLKQGQMPDTEVMGAMGISKKDMSAKGVKFDASGSLVSSAEEAMVALEKIIDEKYGGALKRSADTTKALQASITDSLQMIERSFGQVVNNALKPFYKAIGNIAKGVSESMFPELFAEQLMKPLEALIGTGKDLHSVFLDIIAALAAMANIIPRNLSYLIKEWNAVSKEQSLRGGLQRVGSRSMTLLTGVPRLFDPTGKTTGGTGNVAKDYAAFRTALETKKMSEKSDSDKRKRDPFGAINSDKDKDTKDVKKHLQKIESNTKKSADLLDLRRQTIGGGELASLGVTGAELAGMGMRTRSELTLQSPIRPDTNVIRGIKDLVFGNMNFALQGSPINRVRF